MADTVYAHWFKMKKWSLHDAISIFADYEVMQLEISDPKHFYTLRESIYKRRVDSFRRFFRNNINLLSNVSYLEDTYDSEEDHENDNLSIDLKNTFANSSDIINWAVISGLKIPEEFQASGNKEQSTEDKPDGPPVVLTDDIDLDKAMLNQIDKAPVYWLKKKVKELTNEKDKWDRSIVAATQIGLLFYEKGLEKPATKPEFIELYDKEFEKLPKSTIEKIYQSLPVEYRSAGGSPAKEPTGVDDDTVDVVIEASAYAGYLTNKEGIEFCDELEERLTEDEYEIPDNTYLKAIQKACKKVMGKYT